jgi:glucosamine--fructose-6-phosphate aminotransferase (isomerizing)
MAFDPEAPLPGAPDPWASSTMPPWRGGPPYAMTEMIAAEPALAQRLATASANDPATQQLARDVRATTDSGQPITVTGCGTSEHAALVGVALLRDALLHSGVSGAVVQAAQAFELLGRPPREGLLIGVSHEGGTWATNEALRAARGADTRTALITVSDRSPGAALADIVVQTREQDQSWCHTVGYLSPMIAFASVAANITGTTLDATALRSQLAASADEGSAESMAKDLVGCDRLLTIGSGVDYATARELALKLEEGTHLPATAHYLETIRHGHLAAATDRTGLVLVLTDGEARGQVVADRAASALQAAAKVGMPAGAILAADRAARIPDSLTPVGRMVVEASGPTRIVAGALGAAIPLQLLTERLARARGVNPDTLGREDPRQAAAGGA